MSWLFQHIKEIRSVSVIFIDSHAILLHGKSFNRWPISTDLWWWKLPVIKISCVWNNPGHWTLSKIKVCLWFTFSSLTDFFFGAWISESLSPTPHYNSSILQDLIMDANEEYRATILESHPNLKDGILLLKVWLRQRGLDQVSSLNLLFPFWVVLIDSMWLVCR